MQEIKNQLEKCFNEDKLMLLSLTFNESYLFYDEPQNFEDYFDLIKDLSIKKLQSIINNFNQ
jgi:hypothetical protein